MGPTLHTTERVDGSATEPPRRDDGEKRGAENMTTCGVINDPTRRLTHLAAALGVRVASWRWLSLYERWSRGEKLSGFHRKWLAFTAPRQHLGVGAFAESFPFEEFAATKPWKNGGER